MGDLDAKRLRVARCTKQAHLARGLMERHWLSSLLTKPDLQMSRFLFNVYESALMGAPLSKKEAWSSVGIREIKTGRKYLVAAEQLGLIKSERSIEDRRLELLYPTEHLERGIERELKELSASLALDFMQPADPWLNVVESNFYEELETTYYVVCQVLDTLRKIVPAARTNQMRNFLVKHIAVVEGQLKSTRMIFEQVERPISEIPDQLVDRQVRTITDDLKELPEDILNYRAFSLPQLGSMQLFRFERLMEKATILNLTNSIEIIEGLIRQEEAFKKSLEALLSADEGSDSRAGTRAREVS